MRRILTWDLSPQLYFTPDPAVMQAGSRSWPRIRHTGEAARRVGAGVQRRRAPRLHQDTVLRMRAISGATGPVGSLPRLTRSAMRSCVGASSRAQTTAAGIAARRPHGPCRAGCPRPPRRRPATISAPAFTSPRMQTSPSWWMRMPGAQGAAHEERARRRSAAQVVRRRRVSSPASAPKSGSPSGARARARAHRAAARGGGGSGRRSGGGAPASGTPVLRPAPAREGRRAVAHAVGPGHRARLRGGGDHHVERHVAAGRRAPRSAPNSGSSMIRLPRLAVTVAP